MKKWSIMLLLAPLFPAAQNLTFSKPAVFIEQARSDRSVSLAKLRQHCFAAWKDPGKSGAVNIAYVPASFNGKAAALVKKLANANSAFAPFLCAAGDVLYLLWIDNNNLRYAIIKDTAFAELTPAALTLKDNTSFADGISVCSVSGKLVISSHASSNNVFSIAAGINADGSLGEGTVVPLPKAKSVSVPSVTPIAENKARSVWVSRSDKKVYYCDYDAQSNQWQTATVMAGVTAETIAAGYNMPGTNKILYAWKTSSKDGRLQYKQAIYDGPEYGATYLPDYFATAYRLAVCHTNGNNFLLAYTGTDQKLYVSKASDYNPAKWMEQAFFPAKENYTLKDIVLPGAHDAGMSVLTATGGKKPNIINECNTLTQVQNIEKQLNAGIRMFDLRIDTYNGALYTKHAPSDCMTDAVAGGYGEKLDPILKGIRNFLSSNNKEFVVLGFAHICPTNLSPAKQAETIVNTLGAEKVFNPKGKKLSDITLKELAGKVLITFEGYTFPTLGIDSNTMSDRSTAFINYKREYAATNVLDKLFDAEKTFFASLNGNVHDNDLVRLDWQLTEASEEAAFICNDFQSEKSNPLLDAGVLLMNKVKNNKSIIDLSWEAARHLPVQVSQWLDDGTINRENKPNVLYVDVAGAWATDVCLNMNKHPVYNK